MNPFLEASDIAPLPFGSVKLNDRPHQYRCPRDWSMRMRMTDYDLWLIFGGNGTLQIDGESLRLKAPEAVLLRPGELILGEQEPHAPLEVVALHFTPLGGRTRKVREWAASMRCTSLEPAKAWREIAEWLVGQLSTSDKLAAQQGEALAFAMLAGLWRLNQYAGRNVKRGDDRVDQLIRLIQREPEREWSVATMSRLAQTGATRLNRRFREITGFSPARWVIRCRVERAAVLLRETSMKTAAIAEACGYSDVYFFARQFRQTMRRPPGEWREACYTSR